MNRNRPRTQRRLKAQQALSSRYSPEGRLMRTPSDIRRTIQMGYADRTPVSLALDFEVQTRDKSGRWRKLAGEPRVHTFGLARLRAEKVARTLPDSDVAYVTRVRNIKTSDVWKV